jgi:hypothetical protein
MGQQGDYGQQQDPRFRRAATPPQWQQQAPPRQDSTRPAQPQYQQSTQPTFTPGYRDAAQPPRPHYPPQPAWQQQPYAQQQYQPGPPRQRNRHAGRKIFGTVAGVAAAIIVIAVAANSGHGTTSTLSAGPGTQTQTAAPVAQGCAKGYMSDGQGFSRQGLIQQMTSADGDQFTEAQAEYAADAVGL